MPKTVAPRSATPLALAALTVAAPPPVLTVGVTPGYWDDACRHLSRRDRKMKGLIPRFGEARLRSRGDAFTTLARSIVGQQISVKAAQAVWDQEQKKIQWIRMLKNLNHIQPCL